MSTGSSGTGISIFLIAVGAILFFAVSKSVNGLNLDAVGIVLMIVGGLGLVISVVILATARGRGAAPPSCRAPPRSSAAPRSYKKTCADL